MKTNRIYNNVTQIWVLVVGLLFAWSCSDEFLEKEPTAMISAEKAFTTQETINSIRASMYARLFNNGTSNYGFQLPVVSETRGNDMVYGNRYLRPPINDEYEYKVEDTSNGVNNLWSSLYDVVEITNTITKYMDIPEIVNKAKDGARLKAEAQTVRGMLYVDIARFFGKAYHLDGGASLAIPYIKELQYDPSNPGVVKQPYRNTMKEIYEFAIKDLTEAIPNLPDRKGNENYMNKAVAYATLSRIYLDIPDYAKAKEFAEKAIDGLTLMTDKEYLKGDLSRLNNESILCLRADPLNYVPYRTLASFFDNYDGMGECYLVNPTLFALFKETDLRRKFFVPEKDPSAEKYKYWEDFLTKPEVGLELAKTLYPKGYCAYGKMPRKDSDYTAGNEGKVGLADHNYIRGSEMVLTIAECEARLGNEDKAKEELYKIQHRADPTVTKSTKTREALLEEILLERRKELFGEGHSYRDILRLGKGLHRDGSHPTIINIPAGDPLFQFPIPRKALESNPNLAKERP